jgi:hypothetical protein
MNALVLLLNRAQPLLVLSDHRVDFMADFRRYSVYVTQDAAV